MNRIKMGLLGAALAAFFIFLAACADETGTGTGNVTIGQITPQSTTAVTVTQAVTVSTRAVSTAAVTTTTAATTTTTVVTTVSPQNPPVTTTTDASVAIGSGLKISGLRRSGAEYDALMEELNEIIAPYASKLSFSYENPEYGVRVCYDADKRYNSCSIIKAPYVKSLLANNVDLSSQIVMTSALVNGYSGRIDDKPVGTAFETGYLISKTIVDSNNTSYSMLYDTYKYSAFNEYTNSLGLTTRLGSDYWYRKVSANEMCVYFRDIYNYFEEGSENAMLLRSLMTNCSYNMQIGYALPQYEVAQKYGAQNSTSDFHNCAIVYAESPFILTVLTNLHPENTDNLEIFRQLAVLFDEFNTLQIDEVGTN